MNPPIEAPKSDPGRRRSLIRFNKPLAAIKKDLNAMKGELDRAVTLDPLLAFPVKN